MSHRVVCRKYQKELPGLTAPPFPGARGQRVYETVSLQAWQEWLQHQTMLINEKHLNVMDMTTKTYLAEQMDAFFDGGEVDQVEGYVEPDQDQ